MKKVLYKQWKESKKKNLKKNKKKEKNNKQKKIDTPIKYVTY